MHLQLAAFHRLFPSTPLTVLSAWVQSARRKPAAYKHTASVEFNTQYNQAYQRAVTGAAAATEPRFLVNYRDLLECSIPFLEQDNLDGVHVSSNLTRVLVRALWYPAEPGAICM